MCEMCLLGKCSISTLVSIICSDLRLTFPKDLSRVGSQLLPVISSEGRQRGTGSGPWILHFTAHCPGFWTGFHGSSSFHLPKLPLCWMFVPLYPLLMEGQGADLLEEWVDALFLTPARAVHHFRGEEARGCPLPTTCTQTQSAKGQSTEYEAACEFAWAINQPCHL